MKSNLLYKVFAVILSIPLIALLFGGVADKAGANTDGSQTASSAATAYYEPTR